MYMYWFEIPENAVGSLGLVTGPSYLNCYWPRARKVHKSVI